MVGSKKKRFLGLAVLYLIIASVIFTILFPVYWLVVTSLKPPVEWLTYPPTFMPGKMYLKSYIEVFNEKGIQRAAYNSVVAGILGTFFPLLFGSMVAYSLARFDFKIKRPLVVGILLNRMIPPVTLLVPFFIIMRNLNLLDTMTGLVVVRFYLMFPFVVWMLLGFFQRIPKEIDDAAMIDGCDFFRRYIQIGIPLGKVGFATSGIFVFNIAWNELLLSMTIATRSAQTLPTYLASYVGEYSMKWGPMTALSTIAIIPVFIVAASAQKYFIRGITLGSVKG
jgi:multiple sugar transport system permease protein